MTSFTPFDKEDPMNDLCRMVVRTNYEDLPDEVVSHAKASIIDTIGVTIGGSAMEGISEVVGFVKSRGGRPESSIPFYGGSVPASEAGLAIGPMSRAMDYGDIHEEAGHCSEYVIPGLLAAAGLRHGITGKDFIVAFVVGQEMMVRIGLGFKTVSQALPRGRHGGHFIFGCGAAVGKLLGLSLDELENAEGIMSCMTQPHVMTIYNPLTLMVRVHHGFICRDAINACLLSRRGITGPRHGILSYPHGYFGFASWETDISALTDGLGETWHMLGVMRKRYPSVASTQNPIDGILEQMRMHNFSAEDIASIHVEQPPGVARIGRSPERWNPQTIHECQFSLPYTVATAACDGYVFIDSYLPQMRSRKNIRDLMDKITNGEDNSLPTNGARLTTVLKDGTRCSKAYLYAKGHPRNPLSERELTAKFQKCARLSAFPLHQQAVDRLVDSILNIEEVDDVARALIAPLTPQ